MKTVTTIITSYNHCDFIAQAIDSAIAQKGCFRHEILIADDASTDGTYEIVLEYTRKYPDLIRDISTRKNLGISENMRRSFAAASGEYIAMLEGDDFWTDPRKLEKQVMFLVRNPDCSMVFSRINLLTDGVESRLSRHDSLPPKISCADLIKTQDMNPICNFSCCLFRTSYLRMLPEIAYEHRLSEVTVAFFLCLLGPLGYINEPMSNYRIHQHGVFAGGDFKSKMVQALRTFETVRKIADNGAWPVLNEFIENIKRSVYAKCPGDAPRFSIVTVTFNNLEGLKKTEASVREQNFRDYEWIVMDGGSSDGSREFLERLSPQPYYWSSAKDGGIYDAMNRGIEQARGEYVVCMNAGDVFYENTTLQKVASANPSADVVYGDWVRKYRMHEEFCAAPKVLPPFYFFMPRCNICHQAMFVRTGLLQESKFDTSYFIAADWSKWRHFMVEGKSFQYVPVTVCVFEASEGLSSQQTYRNVLDGIRLQNDFPFGVMNQAAMLRRYFDNQEDMQKAMMAAACAQGIYRHVFRGSSRFFWFVRKFRGGIKCLQEHGWVYTWRNLCLKVRRYAMSRGK